MNKATTYNLPSVVVIGCRLVLLAIPSWSCLPSVLRMVCIKSNTMLKHTAEVRPSGWRRKASKERCFMAGLCHCILCKDTDQFSAACLSADDGLHDELPKGSALNAVNTEGYRNDEF